GLVPPPSPNDSAAEIQALYQGDTDLIRLGLLLSMVAGAMTGPFVAAISTQLKRIEGQFSPLTYTQLGLGMLGVLLFIIPLFLMSAAAFRPDRDPDLILALNDAAWLPFVGAFMTAFFQNIAIGVAVFKDKAERVLPRWLGYFNFWVALLFVPAGLILFFKTGPFAWNGVFTFWLPLTVFSLWFAVMFVVLRKAVQNQAKEQQEQPQRTVPEREAVPA
ncbi:MAG: hypothetical protein ACRDJ9_29415, partial [Dehalococcoidia bacterium]